MIFIKLETLKAVEDFTKTCEKYSDKMEVDVLHSRYTVNGASILGVMSLLGNIVTVEPRTDDELLKKYFFDDIEKLGAYEVIRDE